MNIQSKIQRFVFTASFAQAGVALAGSGNVVELSCPKPLEQIAGGKTSTALTAPTYFQVSGAIDSKTSRVAGFADSQAGVAGAARLFKGGLGGRGASGEFTTVASGRYTLAARYLNFHVLQASYDRRGGAAKTLVTRTIGVEQQFGGQCAIRTMTYCDYLGEAYARVEGDYGRHLKKVARLADRDTVVESIDGQLLSLLTQVGTLDSGSVEHVATLAKIEGLIAASVLAARDFDAYLAQDPEYRAAKNESKDFRAALALAKQLRAKNRCE